LLGKTRALHPRRKFPYHQAFDTALLADTFKHFRVVGTIEEHSVLGGLGGSVAEWLTDQPNHSARLVKSAP